MTHSRTIARIVHSARRSLDASKNDMHSLPLRTLFEAFYHAQQFIHFTTYGISPRLVGALKIIAQKVQVRGIISNVDTYLADELKKYADESPNLSVKIFEQSNRPEDWEASPHQKVIVIDLDCTLCHGDARSMAHRLTTCQMRAA